MSIENEYAELIANWQWPITPNQFEIVVVYGLYSESGQSSPGIMKGDM